MTTPPTILNQGELAAAMLDFVRQVPASVGLSEDFEYIYYFEAERLLSMRQALLDAGFTTESRLNILDFGYLHGLVPEFLHRFFPNSKFMVLDHPGSPNFRNPEYMAVVSRRSYVTLKPCLLEQITEHDGQYDLVILGEIIEHLDPTVAAKAFGDLRRLMVSPGGHLLVTTPNRGCIRESILNLLGHPINSPPIPDETMGYPHIHVWNHAELKQILEHYGWQLGKAYFNHGKAAGIYANSNKRWGSWKGQLLTKGFHFASVIRPSWRDYMVSTWRLADKKPIV